MITTTKPRSVEWGSPRDYKGYPLLVPSGRFEPMRRHLTSLSIWAACDAHNKADEGDHAYIGFHHDDYCGCGSIADYYPALDRMVCIRSGQDIDISEAAVESLHGQTLADLRETFAYKLAQTLHHNKKGDPSC